MVRHDRNTSKLDHVLRIMEKRTGTVKDALGQYPVTEAEVCRVWGSVVPQTGSLLNGRVEGTEISRTTHKVVIRYRPDIKPDMWVEVFGECYDILYILDPYLRHETLELFCEVRYGQ